MVGYAASANAACCQLVSYIVRSEARVDVIAKFVGIIGVGLVGDVFLSMVKGYHVVASGPRRPLTVGQAAVILIVGLVLVGAAVVSHINSNRR
jgi:hypothetical protein